MFIVKYHPNEFDLQSRPKNEATIAIVTGKGEKVKLPTEKDSEGNVVETQEVDSLNLLVIQNDPSVPFLIRKNVVHQEDSEDEGLKYKIAYWEELIDPTVEKLENMVRDLSETVSSLVSRVGSLETNVINYSLETSNSDLQTKVSDLISKVNQLSEPKIG